MSGFEVAGLVLGVIPLLTSALEHYRNVNSLTTFEAEGPRSCARRQNPRDEYGRIIAWLLFITYPNALDAIERIEKNILGAEDKNATIFQNSFSSSLKKIVVAVSLSITYSPNWVLKSQHCAYPQQGNTIIVQVAITGLSISGAHRTAEAFSKASLIAGVLSVFLPHAVQQEINDFHGSEDIRNRLIGRLKSTQSLMCSPKSQLQQAARYAALHDRLAESNSRNRLKRASVYSAVLLTAPAYLLSLALTAFAVGLGIHLGCVYTARLILTFGTDGSLGILIFYIFSMFYLTVAMKQLESAPIKRFTRLMNEISSMVQVHPSSPNERDTHSVDGAMQTRPTETHNENVIPPSLHGSRRRHARLPSNQAHAAAMDSELEETSMPPSEAQVDSTTEVRWSSTSALEPSASTPASLQDVPHSHPSADQVPPTNGFRTALERFIRAQEESIDASKALLQSYEINLKPKEYWWS